MGPDGQSNNTFSNLVMLLTDKQIYKPTVKNALLWGQWTDTEEYMLHAFKNKPPFHLSTAFIFEYWPIIKTISDILNHFILVTIILCNI